MPDNRLTPDFIKLAMLPALDYIELNFRQAWDKGQKEAALVLTGETVNHKFFSNGLQLELVAECPGFFKDYFYKLMHRLIAFPMYTVCAINGHVFAGGATLMLCCDYRVFKGDKAFFSLNENLFGAPLPIGMASVLKGRIPSPAVISKIMLTAHRYTSKDIVQAGIVDETVPGNDGPKVVERACEVALQNAQFSVSGAIQMIKERLNADIIEALQIDEVIDSPHSQHEERLKTLVAAASAVAKL